MLVAEQSTLSLKHIYSWELPHIQKPSSRFRSWFHGRNLSYHLPLGPYRRSLKKMISLLIAVTKLNLAFDGQKKQFNMMLNGLCMNDLAQCASLTMKRFEPLPRPLVTVFSTCLESTSSPAGNHYFVQGACVFTRTLHSEIVPLTAPPATLLSSTCVHLSILNQPGCIKRIFSLLLFVTHLFLYKQFIFLVRPLVA